MLHAQTLFRVDRREVRELGPALRGAGIPTVDGVETLERRVLLGLLGRTDLPADEIASAKLVAANDRHRHVDVAVAGQVAAGADEAVAFGQDVEDSGDLDEALGLDLGLEDGVDDLVLLLQQLGVETDLGRHGPEFGDGLGCEVFALDRRLRSLFLRRLTAASTSAAALAGTCAHAFFTFSQSARNDSRPLSVSGCFTRFLSTENGTVAMSAPMRAACVTWFAERIEAAMTSTS